MSEDELRAEVARLQRELREAQEAHRIIARRLAEYERSAPARAIQRFWTNERRARDFAIQRRHNYRSARRRLNALLPSRVPPPPILDLPIDGQALAPVHFDRPDTPLVSIVVPVHGALTTTALCLRTLHECRTAVPFEIIVVDDASPDGTATWLAACSGLTVISLEENVGYLRATNRGAEEASGRWICLLNNDTEVQPGWLEALTELADRDESIGAVGAKLLYPNGEVQEAGGVVWSDASGHNVGRGGAADDPAIGFVRDVDYCSAACLLVDRQLWNELGGFDERFAPAYYEDTDLAFRIREAGRRVVYQPKAVVVHHEGVSHGTDPQSPGKAHQVRNRDVFATRWEHELSTQPHRGSALVTSTWRGGSCILLIDQRIPTPDIDSASVRMLAVIEMLVAERHRVIVAPADGVRREPYASRLEQLGVRLVCDGSANEATVRSLAPNIDLAVVSRPTVGATYSPLLRSVVPNLPIAYDMVDFHALRLQRAHEIGATDKINDELIKTERALIDEASLVIAITEDEADLVTQHHPSAEVIVLPNIHQAPRSLAAFDDRNGVLFVGSWLHDPNRDAIRWLVDEIMPEVWNTHPDITLHIVGSNIPDSLDVDESANLVVHGWLPYLEPIFDEVRLTVAPLRYGAGLKGKVGDALSRGLPTVATDMASEGFGAVRAALVSGETTAEIAAGIIRIHSNAGEWQERSDEGYRLIRENFGPAAAGRAVHRLGVLAAQRA